MQRNAIVLALLVLCSLSLLAQTNTQPTPKPESNYVDFTGFKGKIFDVKNRDPRELVSILSPLGSGFKGAMMQANSDMKTITVRDFPENIATIEEAIKRLDVPKPPDAPRKTTPDVEIRLHVLIASNVEGAVNPYPAELNDVLKQLQTTITYKNYYLLTSIIQRAAANDPVQAAGTVTLGRPFFDRLIDGTYDLRIQRVNLDVAAPAIQINAFNFDLASQSSEFGRARIGSNLTLKDGEKLVVGTASLKDKALILVLSIKVVK